MILGFSAILTANDKRALRQQAEKFDERNGVLFQKTVKNDTGEVVMQRVITSLLLLINIHVYK